MGVPRNLDDVQKYVDNHIQESIHLDYKGSDALSDKELPSISKDVSAFANSDGGVILYGVVEEGHLPVRIDAGSDDGRVNRERLEHILSASIAPKIDGLEILNIPAGDRRSLYVISIPKSMKAPHQDRETKRYYKRYNFKSQPMEDYEISDVRNRATVIPPIVHVQLQIRHGILLYLIISNTTRLPARDVRIILEKNIPNPEKDVLDAPAIRDGIPLMHPGMELVYFYGKYTLPASARQEVVARVRYLHPMTGDYYEDTFTFDLDAYRGSTVHESEFFEQTREISRHLEAIKDQLGRVVDHQKEVASALQDGVALSPTSVLNLQRALSGQPLLRISPYGRNYDFFAQVLGVSHKVAYQIMKCFDETKGDMSILGSIEGMTPSDLDRIKAIFDF